MNLVNHSPLVTIRIAEESDFEIIQKCRFDVYSEQGYIVPSEFPDGRESDKYDEYAVSVVACSAPAISAVGTTRLVLAKGGPLPIEDPEHHAVGINDRDKAAEISRLCIRKKFRNGRISLGLYRTLFHIVELHDINNVYAIVDEKFFEALVYIGFPFQKIGEPKNQMGLTIPCSCKISDVLPSLQDNEYANLLGITELFEQPFVDKLLM